DHGSARGTTVRGSSPSAARTKSVSLHSFPAVLATVLQESSTCWPHAIKGANAALRELRAHSSSTMLRIFYAFDRERDAVLLIGGDKTGDDRFYERMIPLAEQLFAEYLRERTEAIGKGHEQGLKDDEDDEHD